MKQTNQGGFIIGQQNSRNQKTTRLHSTRLCKRIKNIGRSSEPYREGEKRSESEISS